MNYLAIRRPGNLLFSIHKSSGDAVSIDDFTDISFSYGTVASKNGFTWDSVRLGLTYTFTNKDYKGLEVNFGYQF